jgi:hypothetical protein
MMDKVVASVLSAMALVMITFIVFGVLTEIWLWPVLGVSLVVLAAALLVHLARQR